MHASREGSPPSAITCATRRFVEIISRLQVDSSSKVVFLVDKNGQQIAASGDVRSIDATSLASLTAGNVAASTLPVRRF